MKEIIKESEIQCEEIKHNIRQCENAILNFVSVLRKHIKIVGIENASNLTELLNIQRTDPVLTKATMYKRITKSKEQGYRINTKVDTMNYQVIWAFDLSGEKINSYTLYDFDKEWIENVLYFIFEQSEYLAEHEANVSRYFSISVAGMNYSEAGIFEQHHRRLAFNNENSDLLSILNAKVATRTIESINQAIDALILFRKLEKELSEETV